MGNNLTEIDIKQIKDEMDFRQTTERARIKQLITHAKELGDTSDNAEYREAKRERARNESRINYLSKQLLTCTVVEVSKNCDTVGFGNRVELFFEDDDMCEFYNLTSTLRQDAAHGYISDKSPLGSAIMGKKVGDRVQVFVNESASFFVVIKSINVIDDANIPISKF